MYVTQKGPCYMWCPSGVSSGSITFRIFVDDFQHVTNFLKSIMFAVKTNIFYPNSIIKELFENVNKELANVN